MKDREHNGQKFEDTKGVFRRHKSMKDIEHNGQSLVMNGQSRDTGDIGNKI